MRLLRWLFPVKPLYFPRIDPRCKAVSGSLAGYRCSLPRGHELPHRARYSETKRGDEVVGYSEVVWPDLDALGGK